MKKKFIILLISLFAVNNFCLNINASALKENVKEVVNKEISETENLIEGDEYEDITSQNRSSTSRSIGSGLVQFWQVVPNGQTSEGATTTQIMSALQCRPNHNLYPNGGKSEHKTYINSCYVDDALYLGEDSKYYYVYVSGYEGKVAKSESHYFELDLNNDGKKVKYEIQTVAYYIPASSTMSLDADNASVINNAKLLDFNDQYLDKYDENVQSVELYSSVTVKSPSYYANENGALVHYLTNNVKVANNYSKVIVGKAPTWMKSGTKYYSYDGIYFYTNWQRIRVNGSGAVNKNNPFYNYYQYLPFRSTSNYTATTLDDYTKSQGYTSVPGNTIIKSNQSQLVGAGKYFINVQNKFGINGTLQYAMGIHESGWGRSSISVSKNNLFGMNATDNNPYGNATGFPTVENGIYYHAERYISWGYTDPIDDSRYYGSHIGNKGGGMNVSYASDPYWGEKIAGWYYRIDSASGMKDYDYYSIGIKSSKSIYNVRTSPTTVSNTLYQTKNKRTNTKLVSYPVILIGNTNYYYKIKTDTPIVDDAPIYSATYDWSNTDAYISKNAIYISNHKEYNKPGNLKEFTTFSVNNISYNSTALKGKGISGATVTATVDGKTIGTTTVKNDGTFEMKISKQKLNDTVKVTISKKGYTTKYKNITVKNSNASFTASTISYNTTTISGKGAAGSTVTAYVNDKEIGQAKVGNDGTYKMEIPKQKKGETVVIKIRKEGYLSRTLEREVLNAITTFSVNNISCNSTTLKGKGVSGATVTATVDGKTIGTTTVKNDGTFEMKISKQSVGAKVSVKISKTGYRARQKSIVVLNSNTPYTAVINDKETKISGKGAAGSTVTAYINNEVAGIATVNNNGQYVLTLTKVKGSKSIIVKIRKDGYLTRSITIA